MLLGPGWARLGAGCSHGHISQQNLCVSSSCGTSLDRTAQGKTYLWFHKMQQYIPSQRVGLLYPVFKAQ